ncbi:MAG: hypothetical protein WBQ25_26225 [Nitrososphaeraceae archaeon]
MIKCANCQGVGWVTADLEYLDEIDRLLIGIVGRSAVKKMCKGCHGKGVSSTQKYCESHNLWYDEDEVCQECQWAYEGVSKYDY